MPASASTPPRLVYLSAQLPYRDPYRDVSERRSDEVSNAEMPHRDARTTRPRYWKIGRDAETPHDRWRTAWQGTLSPKIIRAFAHAVVFPLHAALSMRASVLWSPRGIHPCGLVRLGDGLEMGPSSGSESDIVLVALSDGHQRRES